MKTKIGIMYAPGTNCHRETAAAVELAGGRAEILVLRDLVDGGLGLREYQGLIFPGGFSYGDHIAAGRVFAVQIMARLGEVLRDFQARHCPILGICNGDQVLMETGLLPGGEPGRRTGALTQNRSARFEGRWVTLGSAPGTFWTDGLDGLRLRLPSAHGEGRLVTAPGVRVRPAFYYLDNDGRPTEEYPLNPAGSPGGVAGVVDPSGLILGMMPHPERAVVRAHGSCDGLGIFRNMVRYCEEH